MDRDIAEADWKLFRKLREIALERFCERVLDEIERTRAQSGKSWHDRYLETYRLIHRRDRELANAFNNPRRSAAILQLTELRDLKLLTDEEFQQSGEETRVLVETIREIRRG